MQITEVLEQQRFDHDSLSNVPRNKRGKKNLSRRYQVTSGFSQFYRENKIIASVVLAILFLVSFGLILGVAAPSLPPSRDQCISTCLVDYYSTNKNIKFAPLNDPDFDSLRGYLLPPGHCARFPRDRLQHACFEKIRFGCWRVLGICRDANLGDEGPFTVEGRFHCDLKNSTDHFKLDGTFTHGRNRCFGLRPVEDLPESDNIGVTTKPQRNDPGAAELKVPLRTMGPRIDSTTRQQKNDLRTAQPRIDSTMKPKTRDLATAQPKAPLTTVQPRIDSTMKPETRDLATVKPKTPLTTVQPKIGSTMNQQKASSATVQLKNHSEKRGLSKLLFFGSLLHFIAHAGRE